MTIKGSCHCGKNAFQIEGDIPAELTRCTCSFCSKRGALVAYYRPDQFLVTTPADDDATYRWNTKLVAHHFCRTCGIATFSDSPAFEPDGSWDKSYRRIGVNARLFDNFDAAAASVTVIDGKKPKVATAHFALPTTIQRSRLTIHSSRRRFSGGLDTGVHCHP